MKTIKFTDFFEEFRPYNETEAKAAISRISKDEKFKKVIKYFYPEFNNSDYQTFMSSISSINDFQIKIMHNIIHKIIKQTSTGLSYSGIENIDKEKNYVFVSNHRDIFLDASILQIILVDEGFDTTEITFGSNLMTDKLVYDIGKINKMFKVYRKGTPKELLKRTLQLSEYIRYTIFNKRQSVWIAQRGGRTKDGFDKTQSGIIKMLNSSGTKTLEDNLKDINIIPISVSYEFEPNDHLKVKELLQDKKYQKTNNEDINSIIDGVNSKKGRINFSIGKVINEKLKGTERIKRTNEKINKIAKIIDTQIYRNYKLWENNYIAADLLNNSDEFSEFYSQKEKDYFLKYMKNQLLKIDNTSEQANDLFLKIYANPVFNYKNNT